MRCGRDCRPLGSRWLDFSRYKKRSPPIHIPLKFLSPLTPTRLRRRFRRLASPTMSAMSLDGPSYYGWTPGPNSTTPTSDHNEDVTPPSSPPLTPQGLRSFSDFNMPGGWRKSFGPAAAPSPGNTPIRTGTNSRTGGCPTVPLQAGETLLADDFRKPSRPGLKTAYNQPAYKRQHANQRPCRPGSFKGGSNHVPNATPPWNTRQQPSSAGATATQARAQTRAYVQANFGFPPYLGRSTYRSGPKTFRPYVPYPSKLRTASARERATEKESNDNNNPFKKQQHQRTEEMASPDNAARMNTNAPATPPPAYEQQVPAAKQGLQERLRRQAEEQAAAAREAVRLRLLREQEAKELQERLWREQEEERVRRQAAWEEQQRRLYEEQQRKLQEEQERERRQREYADANWRKILQEQCRLAMHKMRTDAVYLAECRETYESTWTELTRPTPSAGCPQFINIVYFPWPCSVTFALDVRHIETLPFIITAESVGEFLNRGVSDASEVKRKLRRASARFHPDKLARIFPRLREEDREFVKAGFEIVQVQLNLLMEQCRRV